MISIKVCNEAYEVEGYTITINKEYADTDIREFISTMAVTQLGSGTPSANNVRPFVLYDRYTVRRNNSYIGVRYFDYPIVQGELNVLTGELATEWAYIQNYQGEPINGEWMSDRDVYASGTLPTIGASVVYRHNATMQMQGMTVAMPMGSNTYCVQFHGESWANGIYEGSEISFSADSSTELPNLFVDIEPTQEGTPWQSSENTEPYLFRQSPQLGHSYNNEYDTIIGGTIAWNQLVQNGNFASVDGWFKTYGNIAISNNKCTYTITTVGVGNQNRISRSVDSIPFVKDHKYLISFDVKGSAVAPVRFQSYSASASTTVCADITIGNCNASAFSNSATVFNASVTATADIRLAVGSYDGKAVGDAFEFRNAMLIDLTQAFGSTIADYVYALEQNHAGDGVAWFKKLFPNPYYAYNSGELKSVSGLTSHKMTGFNQWDEEWESGGLNTTTGANSTNPALIRSKNYIPVIPSTVYYNKGYTLAICAYDADKAFIEFIGNVGVGTFTTPSNCHYIRFYRTATTYNHDICINISDPSKNGQYEPYELHSYPLDSDLTLRGIPKLDANNSLYYDGDTYESDGTVTRKYGTRAYQSGDATDGSTMVTDGTNTVYKLATPTIETADPYTSPQICDPHGTEEYIDTRTVPIPVGHRTTYADIYPIGGVDEVIVSIADNDSFDPSTDYSIMLGARACCSRVCNSMVFGMVYSGTLDVISGKLTVTYGYIDSYNGEELPSVWMSDRDVYAAGTTPSIGAQVIYELEEPIVYQVCVPEIELNDGMNYIHANSGDVKAVTIEYGGETVENGFSEITYVLVMVLEGEVCGGSMTPTFVGGVDGFVLCKSTLCDGQLCPQACPKMGKLEICGEDALTANECD